MLKSHYTNTCTHSCRCRDIHTDAEAYTHRVMELKPRLVESVEGRFAGTDGGSVMEQVVVPGSWSLLR